MSWHYIIFASSLALSRWAPNARYLVTDEAFLGFREMMNDAVDQWRKYMHCSVETSGRHFEHLL